MKTHTATARSRPHYRYLLLVIPGFLAAAALAINSADSRAAASGNVPPAIQLLLDEGADVSEPFAVPDGLTGYAVRLGGRDMVAYVTSSGQYLLLANMISADGVSLTEQHAAEHALPAGDDSLWALLEESDWIGIGPDNARRVIYTFTDARCPYCNALWRASKQYMDGDTQVRHVLVAILGEDSWSQGGAILGADDPSASLTLHEERYDAGGIEPLARVPTAVRMRLTKNNQLMSQLGAQGTPATFYKDRNGVIRMASGMPQGDKIAEIFGH